MIDKEHKPLSLDTISLCAVQACAHETVLFHNSVHSEYSTHQAAPPSFQLRDPSGPLQDSRTSCSEPHGGADDRN